MIRASVFHGILVASQSFRRFVLCASSFSQRNRSALCVKSLLLLCAFVSLWFNSYAQLNTDNQYSKPLKEVLNDVQKKYGVTIKYVDSMVKNKMVTYAE